MSDKLSTEEIESILKDVREARIIWEKAHEMFDQEINDILKNQLAIIKGLKDIDKLVKVVKGACEEYENAAPCLYPSGWKVVSKEELEGI